MPKKHKVTMPNETNQTRTVGLMLKSSDQDRVEMNPHVTTDKGHNPCKGKKKPAGSGKAK